VKTPPCDACVKQASASKHASPHAYLHKLETKEVKSMFGRIDEHFYVCRVCQKEWLHETGSYGCGWI
jgi:hypothetical protein